MEKTFCGNPLFVLSYAGSHCSEKEDAAVTEPLY